MKCKTNHNIAIGLLITILIISGCGKRDDETQSQTSDRKDSTNTSVTQDSYAEIANQTSQSIAKMNEGKEIKPVDMNTLKNMLPPDMEGMKRSNISAEHNQMMGIDMATAEAEYQTSDGNGNIKITIMDTGNMSGPMKLGMAAWTMSQFSRETDTGYEKTITYKGYKGIEKYDNSSKFGSIQLYTEDRFMITVEGNQITIDAIKKALDKIDLKKLASSV